MVNQRDIEILHMYNSLNRETRRAFAKKYKKKSKEEAYEALKGVAMQNNENQAINVKDVECKAFDKEKITDINEYLENSLLMQVIETEKAVFVVKRKKPSNLEVV